jgi:hypothetical protein
VLPDWTRDVDVECLLEARGRDGALVTGVVSAVIPGPLTQPRRSSPDPAARGGEPLYERWWFWTGAGAAVVATVVATILVVNRAEADCAAPAGSGCAHVVFR